MTRQGEEAIGKFAQELLENPVVSGALSAAMETRERAMRAQEVALAALNLPSAADLERLTRRLRSVSQRLEALEDALDRVERRVETFDAEPVDGRLAAIESALNAKMTLVCVLAGCLFPGEGYDQVLARAFGIPGLRFWPGPVPAATVPPLFSASDTCWPLPPLVNAHLPSDTQPPPLSLVWLTVAVAVEEPPLYFTV